MDVDRFWEIIDEAREESGGWEEMSQPLVDALAALDVPEIMLWKQIFDEYQRLSHKNKLWAAAYVINGGCSDDGFDYFRGWLTAQGKDVFLGALANPDSLADVEACAGDVEYEDILGAAACAYFQKTGVECDYGLFYREMDKRPLPKAMKADMRASIRYAEDIDAKWDEEELEERLPKLWAAFE